MLSQELIAAIQRDDFATFATLLRQNPGQINEVDQDGQTLLLYAVKNNRVAFVKELLTYEHLHINQAEPNKPYYSPLFYAISLPSPEIFFLLVTRADVNYTTPRQITPLFLAVLNGKEDLVAALLQAGAEVNIRDDVDNTPTILAASLGYFNIVELLLKFHANPDQATQVSLSQIILIKKIKRYLDLIQQTQDLTPNGYPPEILQQLKTDISRGLCSGLSALWLWYKRHEQEAEFIQTLQAITRWNGEPITQNLKYGFDLVINTVFWLQHTSSIIKNKEKDIITLNDFPHIPQHELHLLFDIFSEHKLQMEFSFGFIIRPQELPSILAQVIYENKMIKLAALGHSIAITKQHGNYFLYDPNLQTGVRSYTNIQDLALGINQVLNPSQTNIDLQLNIFDLQGQPIPEYPRVSTIIQDLIEQRRHEQLTTPVILANQEDLSSFDLLLTFHNIQALNFLLDNYDIETLIREQLIPQYPIHIAVQSLTTQDEIIAIITKLITKGFEINIQAPNIIPPLIWAVTNNLDKIVTFLLQQNADVNTYDYNGKTPLMYAIINNNPEIVTILLQHGAKVNYTNRDGISALTLAQEINNTEIIARLLAAQPLTTSPVLTWQQQLQLQSSRLPPSPSEEMEPPPHITPDH